MRLNVSALGLRFRSPVLLAAGTCGFGREVASVIDLDRLGGLVTKSVTLEPRAGNPAPRVAELGAGMVNSVGLANPGAHAVLREKLPWLRDHLDGTVVFVSVAGHTPEEYSRVVEILDEGPGFAGFELNLSCPNDTRRSGLPFALDPEALAGVLSSVRERTERPLLIKLAPNTPDLAPVIGAARENGADGITLVNTLPGLALDPNTGAPRLGAGAGGVSGPALRAVGVHAVRTAARHTTLPLVGVGGITSGSDALQYLRAGASLVQIGTASFWDPRTAERVVRELHAFGSKHGIREVAELVGSARDVRGGAAPSAETRSKPDPEGAIRG